MTLLPLYLNKCMSRRDDIVEFLQAELNSITHDMYHDDHTAYMYQLGLTIGILTTLINEDSKNYYIIRRVLEQARERAMKLKMRHK